jgi:hypothetical protein
MHGETVLCIGTRVWHSLWRSTQQIMSRISKQNRVLYFEPGRNPDRRQSAEMWRNLPNFYALRAQTVNENLIIVPTPPCLPVMRRHLPRFMLRVTTPWVARINARMMIRQVRRAMEAYCVSDPILWLYSPYHADLVGKFGEKLACYYVYDEFSEFSDNVRIKELVCQFDKRLSSRVDVVFASSRVQGKRRKAINPNTYFSPNGVDFDLFHRALEPNGPLPPDIATVPRPIIGFAGWLGYQIDAQLLLRVAETYPERSLVLVGPDQLPDSPHRTQLHSRSNVFFLGRKERDELPDYLRAFDAALIPYSLNGHVLSIYPLKLHEYLAAGRATVAVAMPELKPYNHVVRIAETQDEFVHHVDQAIDDNSHQAIAARVAVARENTWDQRVSDIYRVLEQHLAAPQKGSIL